MASPLRGAGGRRIATRSRRPHEPNATSGEGIGKIVHLRKTYYFGPGKISMYLKRYPAPDSRSTVLKTELRCRP